VIWANILSLLAQQAQSTLRVVTTVYFCLYGLGNVTSDVIKLPFTRPVEPGLQTGCEMRLFCFPYAGGSCSIFRNWGLALPKSIEIFPVELPGRGARYHEAPYTELSLLVKQIARELVPFLDKPFALFGHSMGAIISFELARRLRADQLNASLLVVSGRDAPHLPQIREPMHSLPDREFLSGLSNLNGTPREVLNNPELMEVLLPLLRADFRMIETYTYVSAEPLDCPIMVFGGFDDRSTGREGLKAWRQHTTCYSRLQIVPGDHFFLTTARLLVLDRISKSLQEAASGHL
jgi:surfactin synthase thioesterase subunit